MIGRRNAGLACVMNSWLEKEAGVRNCIVASTRFVYTQCTSVLYRMTEHCKRGGGWDGCQRESEGDEGRKTEQGRKILKGK